MTDEKRFSEKDVVLRERAAFAAGIREAARITMGWDALSPRGGENVLTVGGKSPEKFATSFYPLPKVTRPRVVRDPNTGCCRWRVVGCGLQWSFTDAEWKLYPEPLRNAGGLVAYVTEERAALWADLLANPTEDVDADD